MKSHWLYSTAARRKLWITGIVILLLTVIAEVFIKSHPYFEIAEFYSFHAVFGFVSCVVMIIFAKLLGFIIKRRDDYYDH